MFFISPVSQRINQNYFSSVEHINKGNARTYRPTYKYVNALPWRIE
jgi:hypothetical protein